MLNSAQFKAACQKLSYVLCFKHSSAPHPVFVPSKRMEALRVHSVEGHPMRKCEALSGSKTLGWSLRALHHLTSPVSGRQRGPPQLSVKSEQCCGHSSWLADVAWAQCCVWGLWLQQERAGGHSQGRLGVMGGGGWREWRTGWWTVVLEHLP